MRKADWDMVTWLREQIAIEAKMAEEVIDTWAVSSSYLSIRKAVLYFANRDAVVARCKAHTAILDRCERAESAMSSRVSSFLRGQDDGYREACLDAVRDVAAALAHLPGYRPEWRPQ